MTIYEIINEYRPDNSLFTDEEPGMLKIKNIIFTSLSESDRRILLLYAHHGNLRDVGRILNVSATTIAKHINKIRQQIFTHL